MIFLSSTCFQGDPLTIDSLPAPARGLELSGGLQRRESSQWISDLERFRNVTGAELLIHNYFPPPDEHFVLNLASENEKVLTRSLDLCTQAIEICRALDIPWYSFHPGYLADGVEEPDGHFSFRGSQPRSPAQALKAFHRNFQRLHETATKFGVALAVENLFPTRSDVTSLANTLEEIEALIAPLPRDVGLLLDLGHLAVSSTILGFDRLKYLDGLLSRHGDRLYEVHLSGNDGETDAHLPILAGDWQLDVLPRFRGLPGADGNGVRLTLESRRLPPKLLRKTVQLITCNR